MRGVCGQHSRRPRLEPLEDRTLLATTTPLDYNDSAGSTFPLGLTPAQIANAYGFDDIYFQGGVAGDGTGQTIAIVDPYSDPNISADFAQFDQAFGLPAPAQFTIATPQGTPQPAPPPNAQGYSWGGKTALDVEWAHALAPGASILLVEVPGGTTNQIDQNLISGVRYASSQTDVSVISMSWVVSQTVAASVFTTPTEHQGITYVAGAGDNGSPASYPADLPNVLSVGGTYFSQAVDAAGDYTTESAWSLGGGGIATLEPQPSYQVDAAIGYTGGRAVPDVAFDAGTTVSVYDSYDYAAPWVSLGGTSIGAPAWSALIAIADQGRNILGQGTLDGASQTLPLLYSAYGKSGYADAFNDITTGGNNLDQAGPGYDLVTGLGTPKAPGIAALLSGDVQAPVPIAPGSGSVASTEPTFEWSAVSGAAGYELTATDVATKSQPFSVLLSGTTTSYTPTTQLVAGDQYSWTLDAVLPNGSLSASPVTPPDFAVVLAPVPVEPSGVLPLTAPTFEWQSVPGASSYDLSVYNGTTNALVFNKTGLTGTSYTWSSASNSTTYDWTVSASVRAGSTTYAGQASAPAFFTVDTNYGPMLISPQNNSYLINPPTFTWSTVPDATFYTLVVTDSVDDGPNPTTVIDVTRTATSYTPSGNSAFYNDGLFQWTVTAQVESDGVELTVGGNYSATFSYEYVLGPGDVGPPSPSDPAAGAVVYTAIPTFSWYADPEVPDTDLSLFDMTSGSAALSDLSFSSTPPSQPGTLTYTTTVPLDSGHTYEWSVSYGDSTDGSMPITFTVSVPGGGSQTLAAPY